MIQSVTWAHPKYGSILATGGQDGFIKFWSETLGEWKLLHEAKVDSAVQCIAWAPWEYGQVLAAGLADGSILILAPKGDTNEWKESKSIADKGIRSLSWGPASFQPDLDPLHLEENPDITLEPMRLVTASPDNNKILLWQVIQDSPNFVQ